MHGIRGSSVHILKSDMEELQGIKERLKKRNLLASRKVDVIFRIVQLVFEIDKDSIIGIGRKRCFVDARFAAIHLISRENIYTLKEIGALFSNRDHSSIINAIFKAKDLSDTDCIYRDKLDFCINEVDQILKK